MHKSDGRDSHIGIVTGLADLVNFLAVFQKRVGALGEDGVKVKAVLFGQPKSLPERLKTEFFETASSAFPFLDTDLIPPKRVGQDAFTSENYAPPWCDQLSGRRIVYTNGMHKSFHQSFYEWLVPDEIVFFDNGLSSYAEHKVDIQEQFSRRHLPMPRHAYLGLHPPLERPAYLSFTQIHSLGYTDFAEIYRRIRSALPSAALVPELPKNVIIGTSLFRTGRISWEEERDVYLRLIDLITKRNDGAILYKAHPRASERPLINQADGAIVLDNSLPIEVFAKPNSGGVAYSISSTALITLPCQFGWHAYRIENDKIKRLLEQSPHLSKIDFVEAISV